MGVQIIRLAHAVIDGCPNHSLLEQARRMLAAGREPEMVLQFLANTLTNRLMHAPSQRLRDAAERGDAPLLEAARTLFAADRTE